MAYDSARGVTVLFGGSQGGNDRDDTWEWDGAGWTYLTSGGPLPCSYHDMAYDTARHVTVLFNHFSHTWEWNGANWARRSISGPSPRYGYKMAYDAARAVTVLFGGHAPGSISSADTWVWDGAAWVQRSNSGPSPQEFSAMVYDTLRRKVIWYGDGEIWEWDGTTWVQRSNNGPPPCWGPAMAYDSARAVTVMYGGGSTGTWEWNTSSACAQVTIPVSNLRGDFTCDSKVDAEDLRVFGACSSGPAVPYIPGSLPPGCTLVPNAGIIPADFDSDGDVDCDDFGEFQLLVDP